MAIQLNKSVTIESIILIFIMAIVILVGNYVGYGKPFIPSLIAMLLIAFISTAGYIIGLLPLLKKLPNIVWISFIGIFVSSPAFPWQTEVLYYANHITFASVSTPVLAFAGLSIGKDLALFKKLSWKIVPVSIAVFSGTFIFAAVLAHFTLQW